MIEGRIADRPEQHAPGPLTGCERGGRQAQGAPAPARRRPRGTTRVELASESARDGFEHEPSRRDDLGADAVARKQND